MSTSKRILALRRNKNKLKIAILDDDQEDIDYITPFVRMTDGVELIYTDTNPQKMLTYLQTATIDLLFLDIEMPHINGMAFLPQLKFLKGRNPNIAHLQVVVCSAHEQFAVKTYTHKVADYLTKPVTFERYLEAVHEVKQRLLPIGLNTLDPANECLTVFNPDRLEIQKVNYKDIIFVEAAMDRTRIWIDGTRHFEVHQKFAQLLSRLPKANFVQVHRSYAISLAHFSKVEKNGIRLHNTDILVKLARRGGYEMFENWLAENAIRGKLVERSRKKREGDQ